MMSQLIERAYRGIFPDRKLKYSASLEYGRLHNYNANVRRGKGFLKFQLAKAWKDVDDDIKVGLVQELICKTFRVSAMTQEMEMYKIFIKKLAMVAPKTVSDPLLEQSFSRVNEKYFGGMLDMPNLRFGGENTRTVGTYNFHTDTVTISRFLMHAEQEILDYVMYHELLHKKLQFDHKKFRMRHHTSEFRKKEKEFEDSEEMEKRLGDFLRKRRFPLF